MRKMLSTAVVLGLSGLLIGCPAPGKTDTKTGSSKSGSESKTGETKTGETKTAAPAKADVSHVKKGQVYTYEIDASGSKSAMKYVVTDVTDSTVTYDTFSVAAGKDYPGAKATVWGKAVEVPATTASPAPSVPEVKTSKETVEVAGKSWDCMVSEVNGNKTWVPQMGGVATFPPFVKMEGASMKMSLTKIE